MNKDLGLAQDAAKNVEAYTPLGASALQIYRNLVKSGYGDKDFGCVFHYLNNEITEDPTTK